MRILICLIAITFSLKNCFAQSVNIYNEANYAFYCKCKFKQYDYVITLRHKYDSSLYLRKFYVDSNYKKLFIVSYFKKDTMNGPLISYDLFDGTISEKGQYLDNKRVGSFYNYNESKLRSIERYKDGKLSGISEYYNSKGKLKKKILYKDNIEVSVKKFD